MEKSRTYWLIPKRYRSSNRPVNLLELFFDVLIVALVGGAIHFWVKQFEEYSLHNHFDVPGALFELLQVTTVIFLWRNFMLYSSRYHSNDIRHRVFTMILMMAILLMDVSAYIEVSDADTKEVMLFVNLSGILVSLFLIAYLHFSASLFAENPYEKKFLRQTAFARIISMVITIASFMVFGLVEDTKYHYIALAIWLVMLIHWVWSSFHTWTNKYYANTEHISRHLIQERYSILLIVFLGELSIQLVTTIATHSSNISDALNGIKKLFFTFVMVFMWWWIFKENYNYTDMIRHPKRLLMYTYSMIGVFISMMISSVAIDLILDKDSSLEKQGKYVFAVGIVLWGLFSTFVSLSVQPYNAHDKWIVPQKLFIHKLVMSIMGIAINAFVFLPELTGFTWLLIVMGMSVANVIFLEIIKWQVHKHKDVNVKEFEDYVSSHEAKEEKWFNEKIKDNLDHELHKRHEYNINYFSERCKAR